MEEKNIKRRLLIRNVIIIFLLVMLILTFASNTIMNYSLPEVAVTYATYGTITKKIRGEATIVANQSYNVTFDETRTVASVEVKTGQVVAKGDVLYTLEPGESGELGEAKAALVSLKQAYSALLNSDYKSTVNDLKDQRAAKYTELSAKKKELSEKETKYNSLTSSLSSNELLLIQLKEQTAALQKNIDKLELEKTQAGYSESYMDTAELKKLIADNEALMNTAKTKLESLKTQQKTLEAEIASLDSQISDIDAKIAELDKIGESVPDSVTPDSLLTMLSSINDKKDEIELNRHKYAAITDAINAAAAYKTAAAAYDALVSAGTATAEELANAEKVKNDAQTALTDAETVCTTLSVTPSQNEKDLLDKQYPLLNAQLSSLQSDYNKAYADYNSSSGSTSQGGDISSAKTYFELQKTDLNSKKTTLTSTLDNLTDSLAAAQADYDKYSGLVDSYKKNIGYDTLNAEIEKIADSKKIIDDRIAVLTADIAAVKPSSDASTEEGTTLSAAITALKAEVTALNSDITALNKQIDTASTTSELDSEIYEMQIEAAKSAISDKEAEIEKLENKATSGTVVAPVSGTVESLSYVAGQKISANDIVAAITLTDKGYTMTYTVTNEQAASITVGAAAEIQYYWWGETPTARVVSIKNDTSNPGKSKIITIEITGDVTAGQSLSFTIGDKGQSYDKIIPSSAVREDTNGKYVLVVDAKSTPLGNRYTARRVDVTVIINDETNSAISGDFAGGEYIITTASAPISAGMQIRLAE